MLSRVGTPFAGYSSKDFPLSGTLCGQNPSKCTNQMAVILVDVNSLDQELDSTEQGDFLR